MTGSTHGVQRALVVRPVEVFLTVLESLVSLGGPGLFFFGFFAHAHALLVVGEVLIGVVWLGGIATGKVRRFFVVPLICLVTGVFVRPWYAGVFWPLAVLGLADFPASFLALFCPRTFRKELSASIVDGLEARRMEAILARHAYDEEAAAWALREAFAREPRVAADVKACSLWLDSVVPILSSGLDGRALSELPIAEQESILSRALQAWDKARTMSGER